MDFARVRRWGRWECGSCERAKAERRERSEGMWVRLCLRDRVKVRFREQEAEVYAIVQQSSIEIEEGRADSDPEDAWPSVWGAIVRFRG